MSESEEIKEEEGRVIENGIIEIDDIYIPRRYSADAIRLVPRVSNHNTEVYLRRQQFLSS